MGAFSDPLLFGEWRPDVTDMNTGASAVVLNVVPRGDGYGPFPGWKAFTQALPAECRGAFMARNADGSITIFAGTATKLYKLDNTTFGWTDVSKGAGTYSSLVTGAYWGFVQFNTFVIAVQVNAPPQVFQLGVSTAFADLGGSPPQAAYIAVISRFLVLGGILGYPNRVQWSGLNATTTWDNVTAQSNYQDLADGGRVLGIEGGDQFGVIFQDSSIRSMTFAPGSAYTFDILRIATNDGLLAPRGAVTAGDKVYFRSPQGFKMIAAGGYPVPIGREKIDRTFQADFDSAANLLIATTDPTETRVYFAYKSISGSSGQFDKVLVYDTILQRWAPISVSGEFLCYLAKPGVTLEGLDPIAPGIITISGTADNGSGKVRLTLSGLSAGTPPSNTDLNVANTVTVYGVTGTTEANGTWPFTIVDSTHIDLPDVAYSNAYISGGQIGGTVDQIPFSLDDVSLASLVQLAMVGPNHDFGFFVGDNLEAILETPQADGKGRRIAVETVLPMTDCATVAASIGYRERLSDAISYTSEKVVNDIGECPLPGGGVDFRYGRAKLRFPSGATWTYATGVEHDGVLTGAR